MRNISRCAMADKAYHSNSSTLTSSPLILMLGTLARRSVRTAGPAHLVRDMLLTAHLDIDNKRRARSRAVAESATERETPTVVRLVSAKEPIKCNIKNPRKIRSQSTKRRVGAAAF